MTSTAETAMTSRNWGQCCTCNFQEGCARGSACPGTRADLRWRKPLRDVESLMIDFKAISSPWILVKYLMCYVLFIAASLFFVPFLTIQRQPPVIWLHWGLDSLSTKFQKNVDRIYCSLVFQVAKSGEAGLWTGRPVREKPLAGDDYSDFPIYEIQCTSSYMFLFKQKGYIRLRSCSPAKVILAIWIFIVRVV